MDFARTATWSTAIKNLDQSGELHVPLSEFLRRGQHFADFCAFSLRESSLGDFLGEAAKCAAAACNAPMAKVLQLEKAGRQLTVIAQSGMGSEVIGSDAGLAEPGNPPGKALVDGEPVVVADLTRWPNARVPTCSCDLTSLLPSTFPSSVAAVHSGSLKSTIHKLTQPVLWRFPSSRRSPLSRLKASNSCRSARR